MVQCGTFFQFNLNLNETSELDLKFKLKCMLACSSDVGNRATSGDQDTKSIVLELKFPERSTVVWEVLLCSRPGFKIKKILIVT